MQDMRKFLILTASLLLVYSTLLQAETVRSKFVLAVQPTTATAEMLEKARPLEEKIEELLGGEVEVEIYAAMSYAAVVEALRFGHAHAALMGAWPAQLAVKLAGAEIPLAEIREVIHGSAKMEATHYYSYWVVMKESPAQKLEDLKNKNACFPSPVSSSGYVAPLGHLVERGLISKEADKEADPKKFFNQVLFGGGYQQCWTALQTGQVDVTVIAGDVAEKLYREVLEKTRVLESQGPVPSHALVFASKLEDPLRSEVKKVFLELGKPENRDLMRSFVSGIFTGFQPVTSEEHLAGLKKYLEFSGIQYTERVG